MHVSALILPNCFLVTLKQRRLEDVRVQSIEQ